MSRMMKDSTPGTQHETRAARRRALLATRFACESLEGRQMLTAGLGFDPAGIGTLLPVTVGTNDQNAPADSGDSSATRPMSFDHQVASDSGPSMGRGHFPMGGDLKGPGVGGALGSSSSDLVTALLGGSDAKAPSGKFGPGGQVAPQGGSTTSSSSAQTDSGSQAIAQLQTDRQALVAKSQVTVAQRTAFEADLKADAAAVTAQATPLQIAQLQTDLQAVGTTGSLDVNTLLTDQAAILTAQGVSASAITQLQTDEQAILTASGVTGADLQKLATDRQAVETAIKAQAPTQATTSTSTTTIASSKGVDQLRTDLQALAAKSQVTDAQTAALANDAQAVRKEITSAGDAMALSTFQSDLKAALGGGTLDFSKLLTDQAAVLSSRGVTQATITQLQIDEQAAFTASGVTQADLTTLANDRAAMDKATPSQGDSAHESLGDSGPGAFEMRGDRGQSGDWDVQSWGGAQSEDLVSGSRGFGDSGTGDRGFGGRDRGGMSGFGGQNGPVFQGGSGGRDLTAKSSTSSADPSTTSPADPSATPATPDATGTTTTSTTTTATPTLDSSGSPSATPSGPVAAASTPGSVQGAGHRRGGANLNRGMTLARSTMGGGHAFAQAQTHPGGHGTRGHFGRRG